MELSGTGTHLTYCTNIHPGETWEEVDRNLHTYLGDIKRAVAPDAPMGVGLRLSAQAANDLADAATLAQFKEFLAAEDLYVFTINGFPYGQFHGNPVKADVYRPDWSEPERLIYSNQLADILAELLPDGQHGSISTVPCTFKPWADGRMDSIADNLIKHAAYLVELQAERGKELSLALEPEPCCYIETVAEAIEFFETHLFSGSAVDKMAGLSGLSQAQANEALHRHIGICYDVCHAAVEFEDAEESFRALEAAGIRISKIQLSSALKVAPVSAESKTQLAPFDEPVYLHQVVQSNGQELARYVDLPDAIAAIDDAIGSEWRCHFHVPVFLEEMQDFATTQAFLRDVLRIHRAAALTQHLEVETYTWDVLPEQYRNVPVSDAVARELNWVLNELST